MTTKKKTLDHPINAKRIVTKYRPGLGSFLDQQDYRGITWRPLVNLHNNVESIEITLPEYAYPAEVAFHLALAFCELDRIAAARIDDINLNR